jgi:hypothetical protein
VEWNKKSSDWGQREKVEEGRCRDPRGIREEVTNRKSGEACHRSIIGNLVRDQDVVEQSMASFLIQDKPSKTCVVRSKATLGEMVLAFWDIIGAEVCELYSTIRRESVEAVSKPDG